VSGVVWWWCACVCVWGGGGRGGGKGLRALRALKHIFRGLLTKRFVAEVMAMQEGGVMGECLGVWGAGQMLVILASWPCSTT
jgi:hypothetical protein